MRVVGQPQVLRNQPGRWPPSPGMTRRSSRSRCRRSWGSMPVSHDMQPAHERYRRRRSAARRRATHGGGDARPAPARGTRRARERKIITATVAARTRATRERAQASRARGNRGGTQTRRERARRRESLHPVTTQGRPRAALHGLHVHDAQGRADGQGRRKTARRQVRRHDQGRRHGLPQGGV